MCNQTCTNTVGSYMCQCNAGYSLGIDETTCFGKTSQISDLGVHWTHKSQISMSVKRKSISVLKGAPILLVPIHVTVILAIHWALMKLPALVRPLKVWSFLSTVLSSHRH